MQIKDKSEFSKRLVLDTLDSMEEKKTFSKVISHSHNMAQPLSYSEKTHIKQFIQC